MRSRFVRSGLTLLLGGAILLSGCAVKRPAVPSFSGAGSRLRVAATFLPLREFAAGVGGELVDLVTMVPGTVEPHEWEPTPGHIRVLNQARVFLYNGIGMEHWVDRTLASLENPGLIAVAAAEGFDANGKDPHVWLDPEGAVYEVNRIREALERADPANTTRYRANAGAYIARLQELDREYRQALTACARQEFFTSHEAFGLLARRYGLTQRAIAGLSPENEPKPRDLANIVTEARAQRIQYIFFETLVSDKVARVVAEEIGAKTLVLNPFEGLSEVDAAAGKDYFAVMRENLANLKLALECGR